MSKKCADCGCEVNRNVIQGMYYCPRCDDDKRETDVLPMTLFDRIAQSPEALAEKLVIMVAYFHRRSEVKWFWRSTIAEGKWGTKEAAIAATVVKLKEVAE